MPSQTARTGDESQTGPWSVSAVPVDQVEYVWLKLEPQILKALRQGAGDRTTPQQMYAALKDGLMSMWVIHREQEIAACCMFTVYQDPTQARMFVELLAGAGMDEWIDKLIRLLKDYRDLIGANVLEASCRPGLAKFLKRKGWRQKAVLMEA